MDIQIMGLETYHGQASSSIEISMKHPFAPCVKLSLLNVAKQILMYGCEAETTDEIQSNNLENQPVELIDNHNIIIDHSFNKITKHYN